MSEIKPRIVDAPTDTMASYGQSFLEAMAKLRVDNEQLRAALAASQAEVERLASMIVVFCDGASWCDRRWKNQEHIKPLYNFAEERRSRDE